MINSLWRSVQALFSVIVMLLFGLLLFSILALQLFAGASELPAHPLVHRKPGRFTAARHARHLAP
jgi:hypothetical protein